MNSEVNKPPALNGLVLAGGHSLRMGSPKDRINWHGKEQRYFLADLLAPFCREVYISCRQDQALNIDRNYQTINDEFSDIGPASGLLSAFKNKSNEAWLIVACDMPFLDKDCIERLVQFRDFEKIATAYQNPTDNLPEPLVSIWEPKSYPLLADCLPNKNISLRKVLINNDTLLVRPSNQQILLNVNTPTEMATASEIMKRQ